MNEEFVIESIKTELLRGRTSLSKLGADQANAPDFGKGRPILIYGPCQSGKSQEICLLAWLAYFCFETVPFIFVMNHGGLGIIPLIMGAVARFNDVIDQLVKSVVPRCSKKEMMAIRSVSLYFQSAGAAGAAGTCAGERVQMNTKLLHHS